MNLLNNIVKETGITKIITEYKEQIEEFENDAEIDCFNYCYGIEKKYYKNWKKIIFTMAGGGSHWWNYEVHLKDDDEYKVYYRNNNGRRRLKGARIFFKEDEEEYGLYEITKGEEDDEVIEYFEDSDDYFEISYYHYFD